MFYGHIHCCPLYIVTTSFTRDLAENRLKDEYLEFVKTIIHIATSADMKLIEKFLFLSCGKKTIVPCSLKVFFFCYFEQTT